MLNFRPLSIVGAICLVASAAAFAQQGWSIVENKLPGDDGNQTSAALVVGDAALILRCRDQTTEAAFSTKSTNLGNDSVTVHYRINAESPIREVWRSSMNGRAAFAPNPMNCSLFDNSRVFIRAIDANGKNKDVNFKLSGVSEVRDKIGRAWRRQRCANAEIPHLRARLRPKRHSPLI
jgi:hypothetical protein